MKPIIDVVIPAFNEAENIGLVIAAIPNEWVRNVVVCDNNSTDATAERAKAAGAVVVHQSTPGYGIACLTALDFIKKQTPLPDIVVFLDGDFSDNPEQLPDLVAPILGGAQIDMVIGSRVRGNLEKGALTLPQKFGNWLSTTLIRWRFGVRFTDLGPFRAIRFEVLEKLDMKDQNFGWTVEMQVKMAKSSYKSTEIPVDYRRRHAGVSKVSGSIKGAFRAGTKILYIIFKYS